MATVRNGWEASAHGSEGRPVRGAEEHHLRAAFFDNKDKGAYATGSTKEIVMRLWLPGFHDGGPYSLLRVVGICIAFHVILFVGAQAFF